MIDPESENSRYNGPERRAGAERRSGQDRRQEDLPWPEDQERRSGTDRRTGGDRREEHSDGDRGTEMLARVKAVLKTTPERWMSIAGGFPAKLIGNPPAPSEWSAVECLLHLIDTERHVFPVRVQLILDGESLPSYDPEAQIQGIPEGQTATDLAKEFLELRAESLELLDQLEAIDLQRTGVHEELGEVTLEELLNEWAAHDFTHTMQAERAMMQPFIRNVGPWKPFFEEHMISAA